MVLRKASYVTGKTVRLAPHLTTYIRVHIQIHVQFYLNPKKSRIKYWFLIYLHSINFTFFGCVVLWILTIHAITTRQIQNNAINSNTNLGCPFIVKVSPISKLWQSWISSLSWVLPFPECHVNGNIQYVIFWDCFISPCRMHLRFIYVPYTSRQFFLLLSSIPFCG